MNKLIEIKNKTAARHIPLRKGEYKLGRAGNNDIIFNNDYISLHHATLLKKGGDYYIVDQDSRNHTFVNNTQVKQRLLGHGDQIRLGPEVTLVYSVERDIAVRITHRRSVVVVLVILVIFYLMVVVIPDRPRVSTTVVTREIVQQVTVTSLPPTSPPTPSIPTVTPMPPTSIQTLSIPTVTPMPPTSIPTLSIPTNTPLPPPTSTPAPAGLSRFSGRWVGDKTEEHLDPQCANAAYNGKWTLEMTVTDDGSVRANSAGEIWLGRLEPDMSITLEPESTDPFECGNTPDLSHHIFWGEIEPEGSTYRLTLKSDVVYIFCDFCPVYVHLSLVKQ